VALFATIPLSGTLSQIVNIRGAREVGVWVPAVTSGNVFPQVSFSGEPATFVRAQNAAGSGDFTLAAADGLRGFTLTAAAMPFLFVRFESAVPQTAVRSLAVVVKW
jgi:hypothetical protein